MVEPRDTWAEYGDFESRREYYSAVAAGVAMIEGGVTVPIYAYAT